MRICDDYIAAVAFNKLAAPKRNYFSMPCQTATCCASAFRRGAAPLLLDGELRLTA